MTEWNAAEYPRKSELQQAMAKEAITPLHRAGSERVLDIGCGDGKVTAGGQRCVGETKAGAAATIAVRPHRQRIDIRGGYATSAPGGASVQLHLRT